jgi:hypothetical protein
MEDPREVVTIGFSDLDPSDIEAFLERVGPQEALRHERLEEILGPDGSRGFYLQVADDDLTDQPPKE